MNDTTSEKIMEEIKKQGIEPRPRWQFLLKRWVFWTFAVLSVVIGGIAFSVATYVFSDNDGMGVFQHPALQDTLQDIAQSIPYIWLFVLGIFTASTYMGFRKTRKGYRYATVTVICTAIVLSIVLGLLLNAFDFGQSVHKYLLTHTNLYDGLIHSKEDLSD